MTVSEPSAQDALLRLTNGYELSQAIHVAATLGIADLLADAPRTVEDLAAAAGAHARSLYRVMRALASAGVFVEADGRFAQTPLSACLRSDATDSVRAWAIHIGRPYAWSNWAHLLHSVRTGEVAFRATHGVDAWEYRAAHPEEAAIFQAQMTAETAAAARALVRSYDFSGVRVLADVGGGEGALHAAILAAHPSMRGILFDQPHVVARARAALETAGLADRCELVGGDFLEAVPAGADAYILKSVIHDWDDADAIRILRACRTAMAEGGKLLVVERVIRPGNEPDLAKLMDLLMLVTFGGGERTLEEFRALYAAADFRLTAATRTESPFEIIEGIPD